ncbi:MAG: CRISPR-associated CARF protein Csa3 [Nitrososphaerota archaeon]
MHVHRLFICTIGWTEVPIVRLVVRHGLEVGDFVLLVKPTGSDEKAEAALSSIKDFLGKLWGEVSSKNFSVLEIDPLDPITSIKRVKNLIKHIEAKKLIAILSGGMRSILLIVLMAILYLNYSLKDVELTIEVDIEGRNEYLRLDSRLIDIVKWRPTEAQLKMLELIRNKPLTMRELAESLDVNVSTVYRWFKEFEKMGLAEIKKEKRRAALLQATDLCNLIF